MRNGATTWRDHDRARNVSKSRISQASEADLSGPLPMSALGQSRRFDHVQINSTLPWTGHHQIGSGGCRFVPRADITRSQVRQQRQTTFISSVGRLQTDIQLRFLRARLYVRDCVALPPEQYRAPIEGVSDRLVQSSRRRVQTGQSRHRKKAF